MWLVQECLYTVFAYQHCLDKLLYNFTIEKNQAVYLYILMDSCSGNLKIINEYNESNRITLMIQWCIYTVYSIYQITT